MACTGFGGASSLGNAGGSGTEVGDGGIDSVVEA